MRDNIMFYPAIVLMVVEAAAAIFLIWSWRAAKKRRYIFEWNIKYDLPDGEDGLCECFIVLPNYFKVLWWFIRRGRKACGICIWKSARNIDQDFEWEELNAEN